MPRLRTAGRRLTTGATCLSLWLLAGTVAMGQSADPRLTLRAGRLDAGQASRNLRLIATAPRSALFTDSTALSDTTSTLALANSDLAFRGNYVFQGNYNGFQIWDVSSPMHPTLRTSVVCPGGQADLSVFGTLLFVSVEETRARVDCGEQGVPEAISADRMRGIRIFDVADLDHPRQIATVQTCRGSHTNTIVPDAHDPGVIYVYASGIALTRSSAELPGCSRRSPDEDPHTSLFSIDVIRVPLASPQEARIVSTPRLFVDSAGNIAGLWKGGSHGPGTQTTAQTNQCHDITVFTAIGLAAGACAGNGILLDIRDPVHPTRVAEVSDPNFSYWHSALFSNDGSKLVFSDEWGGGVAPHCRASDPPIWGADAIFERTGTTLRATGHYKLPVVESAVKNCVAHNGSLIPVPGRDIMAQAWYQGGISVVDFTDPSHVQEIAFFDRGPIDSTRLVVGGQWSAYWYNGHIYGSEISRGLDILQLEPSDWLSQNELDAATSVRMDLFNPQNQPRIVWPPTFALARAYLDQLARNDGLPIATRSRVASELATAEQLTGKQRRLTLTTLGHTIDAARPHAADSARVRALALAVRGLAAKG